jgi:intracellular multiplication protein IcmE
MAQAPGTQAASPAYVDAIQDVNQQNLEAAMREGNSAIPIPIEPPVGRVEMVNEDEDQEDPLQRWRRLQDERLQDEIGNRQVIEPTSLPDDNSHAEAVNALAQAMQAQMQSVLERQGVFMVDSQKITDPDFLENIAEAEREKMEAAAAEDDSALTDDDVPEIIIVPAGEIAYAQIITEANSDIPGPVLGQIVSGPLSGSRILGQFTVENDLISLRFDTVVVDGISYDISTIALDPATTLPGMATEVNHRYFQRIILPTAAAFIEGAAEAVAETGRTDVSVEGEVVVQETEETDLREQIASGIEEAGSQLSDIIEEMNQDIETLVIIHAGTPMGLLFLQPMTRPMTEEDY